MTELRIIKKGSCPSLTGKSNLTYQVGSNPKNEIYIRVLGNSSAGFFSNEWVSVEAIEKALSKDPESITSLALSRLFKGKSVNTPAFLLAALKHEGLVKPVKGKTRVHQLAEDYKERMAQLTSGEAKPKTTRKKVAAKKKRTPARAKAR